MRLVITRHGETKENRANIVQGHLHGTLTEEGKQQAESVADRLKNHSFDTIYSSDLARAADTAKTIAKYHPETNILFTKALREQFFGDWQGLSYDKRDKSPYNGETDTELLKRAELFIQSLIKRHTFGDTVLLVAHNGTIKALLAAVFGQDVKTMRTSDKQHNTAVNIIDIDKSGNYRIHTYNCDKHLTE